MHTCVPFTMVKVFNILCLSLFISPLVAQDPNSSVTSCVIQNQNITVP